MTTQVDALCTEPPLAYHADEGGVIPSLQEVFEGASEACSRLRSGQTHNNRISYTDNSMVSCFFYYNNSLIMRLFKFLLSVNKTSDTLYYFLVMK